MPLIYQNSHKNYMRDVIAVYAQSLSYTDGISDDVPRVLDLLEAVNGERVKRGVVAVSLINDCCLAFSVLVHQPAYRLLERTTKHTPVLMTLDAHKHLGRGQRFEYGRRDEGFLTSVVRARYGSGLGPLVMLWCELWRTSRR